MFWFLKTKLPTLPEIPPPPPPLAPQPVAVPLDDAIHSQKYWERRRRYLQSMAAWVQQELLTAERNERASLETPSAPKTRRKE